MALTGPPNERAALDAAVAFCLYSGARWRRASEPGRSAVVPGPLKAMFL
jgi:hypothetical protein